nr:MAG TPA: hypothetical protein [Caudoviricetes sp.]
MVCNPFSFFHIFSHHSHRQKYSLNKKIRALYPYRTSFEHFLKILIFSHKWCEVIPFILIFSHSLIKLYYQFSHHKYLFNYPIYL